MPYPVLLCVHENQILGKARFLRPGTAEVEGGPPAPARPEARRGRPPRGGTSPVGRSLEGAARTGRRGRAEESGKRRTSGQADGRATPAVGGGVGPGAAGLGVHHRTVDDAACGRPDPASLRRPIPSRPCGPGVGTNGVELPATGGPGQGTERSSHPRLEARGLAAH